MHKREIEKRRGPSIVVSRLLAKAELSKSVSSDRPPEPGKPLTVGQRTTIHIEIVDEDPKPVEEWLISELNNARELAG